MRVRFLVFLLAITLINLPDVYSIKVEEPINTAIYDSITVLEYADEYITIERRGDIVFIGSEPKGDSEENILSYQQKLEERLEYLKGTSYNIGGGIPVRRKHKTRRSWHPRQQL